MSKLFAAVIAVYLVSVGWAPSLLGQEQPNKAAPVDFRACNFHSDKSMQDLDKVTAKFREYANRGGLQKRQKILGNISSCNTPVIFDALSVRARDER